MSRKILLLACIAFVVHAPRSFPQESSNLFVNPEFDIGKAGWAVKAYGSAKATIEVVATAPLSGQNALVVHCTAGGSGLNDIHLYQSKTLQTGRIYTIRFMAVADVPHTIRIAFDEPSGERNTVWETPDIAVGTSAGRFGPYTFQTRIPDGTYKFKFMLGGKDNVNVTVDSVSLTWIDDPTHMREEEKFEKRQHPFGEKMLPYRFFAPALRDCVPGPECPDRFPLVLALHGKDERGTDNELPISLHRLAFTWSDSANQAKWPCYVVVPQCPLDQSWVNAPWIDASYILAGTTISWPLEAALDLVDSLISALPMDTTRLYVTGLSMGGYGSFDCILRFPEKFAAAIPMSGGGDPTEIGRILDVPVWAFHGDRDTSVPVSGSRDMMTAFENAGRPVTHTHCYMGSCNADPAAVMDSAVAAEAKHLYTEYKGKAHVIWAESYDLPQVHQWLFAQSTSSMSAVSPSAPDAVPIEFALFQNFPNPFNPATRISYTLNGPCRVRIEVFDASGRLVSALKDGPEPAGEREAVFDANGLSSGPYVVALSVDGKLRTRKMMLVK